MVFPAPGVAQTPKIGDFRPAQKSCILNPNVDGGPGCTPGPRVYPGAPMGTGRTPGYIWGPRVYPSREPVPPGRAARKHEGVPDEVQDRRPADGTNDNRLVFKGSPNLSRDPKSGSTPTTLIINLLINIIYNVKYYK